MDRCRCDCPCHGGDSDGSAMWSAQDFHGSSDSDISIMTLSPFSSPPTSYWDDDLYGDYDSIEESVIFREDMPDYTQMMEAKATAKETKLKGCGGWGIFTDCFELFKLIFCAEQ
ncbi:unnamed protein product [Camellia sinensis]